MPDYRWQVLVNARPAVVAAFNDDGVVQVEYVGVPWPTAVRRMARDSDRRRVLAPPSGANVTCTPS
jgi:hypothetical protein